MKALNDRQFPSTRLRFSVEINGKWCVRSFTVAEIAPACHVSRRTVERWRRDGVPAAYQELIEYKLLGRMRERDAGRLAAVGFLEQELSARRLQSHQDRARIAQLERAVDHWRARAGAPKAAND